MHGRKLRLIAYDDSYDPAKTQACFDKLMADKVFALGFFVGTPTAVKYLPLAEENKIPLVGLFTGAQILYTPLRHWVINVRASYYDETREQVDELASKAEAAGASPVGAPSDDGYRYQRGFTDLDGHHWEALCLIEPS